MSISVSGVHYNCDFDKSADTQLGYMKQTCAAIAIDVNGMKGPNRLGRDTFLFWITNGKGPLLYPEGGKDDGASWGWWDGATKSCKGTGTFDGYSCAGRVIEENWQMTY